MDIPRIRELQPLDNFRLRVLFDDGKTVVYDVKEDMEQIEEDRDLSVIPGLFAQARVDASRTCVSWNDRIDLPSDTLYEYGSPVAEAL